MKIAVLEKRFMKAVFPIEAKPKPMSPVAHWLDVTHSIPSDMEEGTAALTSVYPERSEHPFPIAELCFTEIE